MIEDEGPAICPNLPKIVSTKIKENRNLERNYRNVEENS
jgi:hypothetical protein